LETDNKVELVLTLSFYTGITTIIIIWIWPLVHQLIRLREAAVQFGSGDLGLRVRSQRFSYVRDIEYEFNRMAERIQSLLRDNKLLSRAVSHDLKTPLARLRFGLDALSETQNEEQRQRYALRVNRDLEAMEALISNLLQYARLDESRIKLIDNKFCLVRLADSLLQTFDSDEIDMCFETSLASAEIRGDRRYVSMLINNLVSNAQRHASHRVLVSLRGQGERVTLSVEDDGAGIPEDERDNVLKPFWRGVDDRGEQGHGMGLAIVDRIVDWHRAELTIADSETLGGAQLSVTFAVVGEKQTSK
ncbi:MAG: two-component sensor histidine kinase, partial [Cellvibrionaceae bacterium]|nr:two-component sensor histidine kinase [Cellvibrionaceae bacterium]